MKIENFSKTYSRLLGLLKFLLAACLAVPLLASASFIFPYTVPKIFAFRILVEIAAALYLYLALKYREFRIYSSLSVKGGGRKAPRRAAWPQRGFTPWGPRPFTGEGFSSESGSWVPPSPTATEGRGKPGMTIVAAILFFFFINLLSAIFGADFYTSWWGNLERGMGVWSLAHFVAWFLMLSVVFKDRKNWQALIKLSVVVSVIVAATALIQRFGGLGSLLPATERVYGLIGNAGIFSGYLIFNIFFAGYLFWESPGRQGWLWALGGCFLVIGLFLSGTRGAYLGLIGGVITGLILLILFSKNRIKKYSAIFLAIIFILSGALFLSRDSGFIKNNFFLSRLTSFSLSGTTSQSRLILWQGAWQAWQARPWLGFGPENATLALDRYTSPRLADYEIYETDRAHNFIFDYGVTLGWLGLASYLFLIGAAGWLLWQDRKNSLKFFIIFSALLAAYLIHNFFIFDSTVSYLMLFFTLAIINNGNNFSQVGGKEKKWGAAKKIILAIFAIFIVFSLYYFNLKPLLAAYRANDILFLPPADAERSAPLLKESLALNTFASPEIVYQAVIDYIDKISQNQLLLQNEEFYDAASHELSKIITRSPSRARNYIALAWLELYFSGQDPARINEAIDLGNKIKDLSPNKKDAYLVLAAAYALSSQAEKAQETILQAEKIDGKMGEVVREYYEKLK